MGELGFVGRVCGRRHSWYEEEGAGRGGYVERNLWEGVGGLAWEDSEVYTRPDLRGRCVVKDVEMEILSSRYGR